MVWVKSLSGWKTFLFRKTKLHTSWWVQLAYLHNMLTCSFPQPPPPPPPQQSHSWTHAHSWPRLPPLFFKVGPFATSYLQLPQSWTNFCLPSTLFEWESRDCTHWLLIWKNPKHSFVPNPSDKQKNTVNSPKMLLNWVTRHIFRNVSDHNCICRIIMAFSRK